MRENKENNMKKVNKSKFELGDIVEVIANKDDDFHDFAGTVSRIKKNGIISVRDQEDDVFDCGENQVSKL
jgi:transcription antitermination factor NusG